MKILLISNGFQPSYEKGFANGLASNGVKVELIASDRTLVSHLQAGVAAINLRGSQDPRRSLYQKTTNMVRYAAALFRYIWQGKHDVVHLTGLFMTGNKLAGMVEWLTYRLLAKRFFMTVHNLLPHNQHTPYNRWFYRIIYSLPDRLVVHTEKMKSGLRDQFGVDTGRVVVMLHGVDAPPDRLSVPEHAPELRVLLFGGLSHYKGTDLFLESLKLCADIPMRIVIAGETRDQAYRAKIEYLIEALPPNQVVQWDRKFIDEQEVGRYFEAADLVMLPYRHIDQSGVLFTAFRYGTPVIATDVGVFRSCLPDFAGMIVPEQTPQSLAQTLRAFSSKKIEFDRARIRVHAQSLTWPLTVKPLINEYKALCQVR